MVRTRNGKKLIEWDADREQHFVLFRVGNGTTEAELGHSANL